MRVDDGYSLSRRSIPDPRRMETAVQDVAGAFGVATWQHLESKN